MIKGDSEIQNITQIFREKIRGVYEYEKQEGVDEEIIDVVSVFGGILLAVTNLYNFIEKNYICAFPGAMVAVLMLLEPVIRKHSKNLRRLLRIFFTFICAVETLYLINGTLEGFGNFWFALVDYGILLILGMRIAHFICIYHSIIICAVLWTPLYKILPGASAYTFEYRLWFPVTFLSLLALIFYSNLLLKTYQHRSSLDEKRLEMEIKRTKRKNENMVLQAITSISELLDAKDPLTAEHSDRVAEYAGLIARRSGIENEREINAIIRAGRLHDIGKMAIPDEILTKKGRLTDQEYETMKMHTIWGREILKNLTFIPEAQEVAGDHHERVDGKGYPKGLAGDEIPKYARIVSVADSLDAMNSNRCYRSCCGKDYIIEQFKQGRGKQFDAHLADIVCELIEDGTIQISSLQEVKDVAEMPKQIHRMEEEVL